MSQSAVSFKSKGLAFEGVVSCPEEAYGKLPGVVLCHPHPLQGGNMDNGVVVAVASALVSRGFVTLRFNFRGVGGSEGRHGKGELEHQEVLAGLDVLKAWPGVDGRKLGLAGYSFGASVILGSPALHKKARAFVLISPSLEALKNTNMRKLKRPVLVVTGERDRPAGSGELPDVLEAFVQAPECYVVPGADHFWSGYTDLLAAHVGEFFASTLK